MLNEIDFQNVEYLTRWILDDSTKTNAVWGPINAAIVTEITGQFKEIDVNQKKLTAFFLLSEDLVNLGPAFIDTYVRTILMEAIYGGLEAAIISGNGKDCPIGLMMDLTKESSGIYAQKTPIVMKDIAKEYTGNVALLAKNEKGKNKNFDSVILVMNLTTKLNKFLPAASFRVPGTGEYVTTMPFPTKVVVSNEIEDNKAVMFVPKRYFIGVGMGKEVGCTLGMNRELLLGLFFAPDVVGNAVKTSIFASELFTMLGFECSPRKDGKRGDIITAVKLGDEEHLCAFCRGIQKGAPVDSFVTPEPWDMPGYSDKVIMAAGAFTGGASIELSADAPLREPYAVWMQGGITFTSGKLGVMLAAQEMIDEGLIQL